MKVPSTAPTTPGNLPIDWSLKLSMVSLIRTAILKHNKIIICYAPLQLTIKAKGILTETMGNLENYHLAI